MKILLPFKEDLNPYLDEIISYSGSAFIYDHYKNYSPDYDIVNIHWPEALFDWLEPTEQQLLDLERDLEIWKKSSVVVYTKHDYRRNKGTTPQFTRLFELIEQNTDVFIHLGEHSKTKYQLLYPKAGHEIVHHPLYQNSYTIYSKLEAREKLGITPNSFVVTVPGAIRDFKERSLVLNSFKALKISEKVLITTNMRTEIKRDFRGRILLKKFFDVKKYLTNRFKSKYSPPTYVFTYEKLSSDDFSLRISAADIILIPRIDILNSGNVFLAFTFRKVVCGPAIGNIKGALQEFKMPIFNPASLKSVISALNQAVILNKNGFQYPEEELEEFNPQNIAKAMDEIFFNFSK